ncbi:hypothetical protein [Streptomyces hygroscopicus]|uniref:hypothetical protein n=1 Tax=Streptomyces hygroscopicus TaxID=1912 RepID=UPI003694F9BC
MRTLHPPPATTCAPTARPVIAAVRLRQGKSASSRGAERFVTEAPNPSIKQAVASLDEAAWQHVRYTRAVVGPDTGELISDAQVAEITPVPPSPAVGRPSRPPPG